MLRRRLPSVDDDELIARFNVAQEATQILILAFNRDADADAWIEALPFRVACFGGDALRGVGLERVEGGVGRAGSVTQVVAESSDSGFQKE